jgi:hypothetical protein
MANCVLGFSYMAACWLRVADIPLNIERGSVIRACTQSDRR